MYGWRSGFPVTPRGRPRLAIMFTGGGSGSLRPPASTSEIAFLGGGAGSLSTKLELAFRGAGFGRMQQKALIAFRGGGNGAFGTSAPAYANGYENYLEFLIPAGSVFGGPHTDFPFLIDDTFSELATVANGGLVQHALGFDMRLELSNGTALDFARRTWSATTGRIVIRARIPTLPVADTRIRLYFGKSVVTDGQNVAGAYAAYILALDCRTGADLTGQAARTFTPTSVGTGSLVGDAGDYNGTSSLMTLSSLAAANGLPAVTLEAMVQADSAAQDGTIFSSGPLSSLGDGQMGMVLAFERDGAVGGAGNTIIFKVNTTNSASRVEGPSFSQSTEVMFLAGRWASGEGARLFINYEFVVPTNPVAVKSGTTLIERG